MLVTNGRVPTYLLGRHSEQLGGVPYLLSCAAGGAACIAFTGLQALGWARKTGGMPVHMRAATVTQEPVPLCAKWMGTGASATWSPPAASPSTDKDTEVTCPLCTELMAHVVVQALAPEHKAKKLHFESSRGEVLCRSAVLDNHLVTRIPSLVTCITCRNNIRRITTRAACDHVAVDRARLFLAGPGSRPIPTALCAACGAVIATALCTECWGDGCDACNDGVIVGPRLRKYETATVTEL